MIKITKFLENIKIKDGMPHATSFSKDVKKNSVFFALSGGNCHGSEFINDAIDNGAFIVFHDDPNYLSEERNIYFVNDLEDQILPFLNELYEINLSKYKFFGFTGTNGKTTSAYLCHQILMTLNMNSIYMGTLGFLCNSLDAFQETRNTTPDIFTVLYFLFQNKSEGIQNICLEVSSHALQQNRLNSLNFDVSSILNIESDHLDYHQTIENYIASKFMISNTTLDNNVIINVDSINIKNEYKNLGKSKFKLFSQVDESCDFFLSINKCDIKNSIFSLKYYDQLLSFSTKIFPNFNILNFSFAVISILNTYKNIDFTNVQTNKLRMPKGRMDFIQNITKNVIIDYAHNADGFKNVLSSVQGHFNKLVCVFGCGGDRDRKKRALMLEIALRYSDLVIFTSDNSRTESFDLIFKDASIGNDINNVVIIEDRKLAIQEGLRQLEESDCLIILGKGHEVTQEKNGKKKHFSDHEAVNEIYI